MPATAQAYKMHNFVGFTDVAHICGMMGSATHEGLHKGGSLTTDPRSPEQCQVIQLCCLSSMV